MMQNTLDPRLAACVGAIRAVLLGLAACSSTGTPENAGGATRDAGSPFLIPKVDAGTPDVHPLRPCDGTFVALARMLFARKGCEDATCHTTPGPDTPAGGLDLTEADAYAALIEVPARAQLTEPLMRVSPFDPQASFLYLKLVAAQPDGPRLPEGGGAPMPLDRPPLTAQELAPLNAWIRAGAPQSGVVTGTEALIQSCQALDP